MIEVLICVSWLKLNQFQPVKISRNQTVLELRKMISKNTRQPVDNIRLVTAFNDQLYDLKVLKDYDINDGDIVFAKLDNFTRSSSTEPKSDSSDGSPATELEIVVCVSWMKLNKIHHIKMSLNQKVSELCEIVSKITRRPMGAIWFHSAISDRLTNSSKLEQCQICNGDVLFAKLDMNKNDTDRVVNELAGTLSASSSITTTIPQARSLAKPKSARH